MDFPNFFNKLSLIFCMGFSTPFKNMSIIWFMDFLISLEKLFYTFCAVLLLLTVCSCHQEKPLDSRPNIILIMADDMGWGDAGFQGNDTILTPNLDRLAGAGIKFNRFYAAAPVCSPTRGSCLTGRHPYRYGIYGANVGKIKDGEITLAEAVKTIGYRTGHFGKWHLGTLTNDEVDANRGGRDPEVYAPPWEHGFDFCFSTESKVPTFDPMVTPGPDAGDIGKREPGSHFGTFYWTGPGQKVTDNLDGDNSRIIMDRVIPFIRNTTDNKQPFLSVIWFHTPHLPVIAGKKYRDMYKRYDEDIQHFYGCITAMDEQIGRLVGELDDLGILDNTIIFFTSDNGPEGRLRKDRTQGSTNGLKGRKRSLYEGGIRVPGLLFWPERIRNAAIVDIPVSTSDYYPTIMDLLKIDMPDQPILDGISLLPVIDGRQHERNKPIGFQSRNQQAFIDERYKIYSSGTGESLELYDIINDPEESIDLSLEFPEIKDTLMHQLNVWIKSCKQSNEGHDYH
jgi:arylsulfatase A-like enzyme